MALLTVKAHNRRLPQNRRLRKQGIMCLRKRISRVSGDFWLLRMRAPRYFYAYKASAEIRRLHVSAEFGGKQSHAIVPCSSVNQQLSSCLMSTKCTSSAFGNSQIDDGEYLVEKVLR